MATGQSSRCQKKPMKKTIFLFVICAFTKLTLPGLQAQTTNVDFLTLDLHITLTAYTNGLAETNGNLATSMPEKVKLSNRDVIQALSNRVVFPILTRITPD